MKSIPKVVTPLANGWPYTTYDPSNVSHATKNVSFFAIENYFNYALTTHKEDIASVGMNNPFQDFTCCRMCRA
jgi:hypothetical protein